MAACPNCRSNVQESHLFCRSCGFCLESDFQVSTRTLGLPRSNRAASPAQPTPNGDEPQGARNRLFFPMLGFIMALVVGGLSVGFTGGSSRPFFSGSQSSFFSERSYIGVYLTEPGDYAEGALIEDIVSGSPADQAGLMSGDRIISVNGIDIAGTADFVSQMKRTQPNSDVALKVARREQGQCVENEMYMQLTTCRREELRLRAESSKGFLGVSDLETVSINVIAEVDNKRCYEGVLIGKVLENTAAERAGLEEGDIVVGLDNHSTRSPNELARFVRSTPNQQITNLWIIRDGQFTALPVIMGER